MNYTTQDTHISTIRAGDTVEHQGRLMTVCASNLKRGFMGITLFGDSYRLGTLPVKKATLARVRPSMH